MGRCSLALSLAFAAAIVPATAALSFTLNATQVSHTFSPELRVELPFPFVSPPNVRDVVSFDTSGISFGGGEDVSFEFVLSAPDGFIFSAVPGPETWIFDFSFDFSDEALDGLFSNLTAMFLDTSVGITPEFVFRVAEGRTRGMSFSGIYGNVPEEPFTFAGIRVTGDFYTPSSDTVTLDSAVFSFGTRDLAIDADPGPALTIQPIPEPVLPMLAPLAVFLVSIRRRPSCRR